MLENGMLSFYANWMLAVPRRDLILYGPGNIRERQHNPAEKCSSFPVSGLCNRLDSVFFKHLPIIPKLDI